MIGWVFPSYLMLIRVPFIFRILIDNFLLLKEKVNLISHYFSKVIVLSAMPYIELYLLRYIYIFVLFIRSHFPPNLTQKLCNCTIIHTRIFLSNTRTMLLTKYKKCVHGPFCSRSIREKKIKRIDQLYRILLFIIIMIKYVEVCIYPSFVTGSIFI